MEIISRQNLCQLVGEQSMEGIKTELPKVSQTMYGEIVKLFVSKKKWYSSDRYKPYAKRFCDNAHQFNAMSISAPKINKIYFCPEINTHAVFYNKIFGDGLDALTKNKEYNLLPEAASFIASLHERGVFFRSMHLSNLVYQNNGKIAVIDISDVRFKKKPLSLYVRYRNLKHTLCHREDQLAWRHLDAAHFLQVYFEKAQLSFLSKKILGGMIKRIYPT